MTRTKRVLIADDDENLVDCLARRCQSLGLKVEKARDGMAALQKIEAFQPDLILLDINMPEGNGLRVCEMMGRDPDLKTIPTIILTGRKDAETIQSCGALSAHYVPKGPHVWSRLQLLVSELLDLDRAPSAPPESGAGAESDVRREDSPHCEPSDPPEPSAAETAGPSVPSEPPPADDADATGDTIQTEYIDAIFSALGWNDPEEDESVRNGRTELLVTRPWVLCIDDDADFSAWLKLRLEQHGVDVLQAHAGMAGYRYAFTSEAQAIILDYELPDGNGDYVLRRLKENPVTRDIPVIVLTGRRERTLQRKMYNLGAARFLNKPVAWPELWTELRRHLHDSPLPAA